MGDSGDQGGADATYALAPGGEAGAVITGLR
jgi:hypothetical protein